MVGGGVERAQTQLGGTRGMRRPAAERHLEFGLVRQADKIRTVLVFYLIAVTVVARQLVFTNPALAATALALAALVSVWSLFFLRWDLLLLGGRLPLAVALLIIFDLAWLSLFIVATGGFDSPFRFLPLLVVVFAAAFFSDLSWALPLTAILVACMQGVLAAAQPEANLALIWDLAGRLLVVIAVAWFTWALASVLERERQANQRIVSYLTEGVVLVGSDGMVLLANPRMGEMCGADLQEVAGRHLSELGGAPGYAVLLHLLGDVLQQPVQTVTRELSLEGKQTRDLRCVTVPCGSVNGRPLGWVVIVQDVTDLKARARLKEKGLGLISHELRSPLASLRVMAQVLSGVAGELSEAERERVAATIERESDRLSRLVADILEITRLEHPDFVLTKQRVCLSEVAGRVQDLFALTAAAQGTTLRSEVPPRLPAVLGDPDRLVQILTNLVDNALKHTPAGGVVTLGAQVAPEAVHLWVRDTGPGVPPEALEVIFEKFAQVGPARTPSASPGLGLGLYMARLLARKHGGDLVVRSQVGRGSTFVLTLPRAEPAPSPPSALRTPVAAA